VGQNFSFQSDTQNEIRNSRGEIITLTRNLSIGERDYAIAMYARVCVCLCVCYGVHAVGLWPIGYRASAGDRGGYGSDLDKICDPLVDIRFAT